MGGDRRALEWSLAVVGAGAAVVIVVGPLVAGGVPALFGSAVASAVIGAALLVRLARRQTRPAGTSRKRIGIVVALLGHAAVSAALVMACFETTLVAGLVLVAFAPSAVVGGWKLAGSAVDRPVVRVVDIRLWVAAAVLFPVAALGLIGFVAGSQADYVRRYGHPVTINTKYDCIARAGSTTLCTVRYNVDGKRGEASISLSGRGPIPRFIEVVALDGRAVERNGPVSPTVVFGHHVPGWLVISAPIEAVLLIVLLVQARSTVVRDAGNAVRARPPMRRQDETRPLEA